MNDKNKQPDMITMPEHIRPRDSEGARIVGRGVVSRAVSEGRYGNPPVAVDKPAGTPIDFPGFDTVRSQPRTFGDTVGNVQRPTEHDPDEV